LRERNNASSKHIEKQKKQQDFRKRGSETQKGINRKRFLSFSLSAKAAGKRLEKSNEEKDAERKRHSIGSIKGRTLIHAGDQRKKRVSQTSRFEKGISDEEVLQMREDSK
jgi:hypothetical protein